MTRATSRLIIMVTPPPGVSSTTISPPIASTNPRATARPSPTPVPFELSPRRWNGWNTCSRCAGGIPGPRSTTRRSTRPSATHASTRTRVSTGDHVERVLDDVRDGTLEQRGVGLHARQRLGRRRRRPAPASLSPASAAGMTSSSATARITSCSAPVCSRLMSSRLPTRWLSRSVPSSMVSSSSRVAPGVKSTSRCSRLLTDALIDESGVRRSCDTAASSAVRSSFASSRSPPRAASARKRALLHRDRDLPGERLEHVEVFGSEAVAADDQHVAARQRHREVGGRPAPPARVGPDTGDDGPASESGTRDSTADRLGVERGLHLRDQLRERVGRGRERAAQRRQRLGLGPRLCRLHRAARRGRHEQARPPRRRAGRSRARGGSPPPRP